MANRFREGGVTGNRPTVAEARVIQESLRPRVELRDRFGPLRTVAGVDVSVKGGWSHAAVVVVDWPAMTVVESATARMATPFPYVPGLLAFREVPVIKAAFARLLARPDLLMIDGQGYAHPRRLGLACHLGVVLGLPAVGVGKSRLVGEHGPVPVKKGEWTPLTDGGETIGAVLRTRTGVKPVYVSPGHRVGLATAVALVMAGVARCRLPEPIRMAHRLAGEWDETADSH